MADDSLRTESMDYEPKEEGANKIEDNYNSPKISQANAGMPGLQREQKAVIDDGYDSETMIAVTK